VLLDDLLVVAGRRSARARSGEVEVRGREDPWRSALDLLEDEVPGLDVRRVSGQVSGGASIRIRGAGSFQNNEPSIYLDGVRIDDVTSGFQAPRMLELIPAESVARIRVLRGPTALYPYAANGVIVIETVGGRASRQ
jgi:outer membrane cobalamin receptor